jgi:Protein of unknown function (DUF3592)
MHVIAFVIAQLLRPLLSPFTGLDHALQDFFRGIGTNAWYVTNGTVESIQLKSTGHMWRVTLAYSYSAETERWPGKTFRQFVFERQALRYAQAHPIGSTIAVRYGPGKPEESVVLKYDQRTVHPEGSI